MQTCSENYINLGILSIHYIYYNTYTINREKYNLYDKKRQNSTKKDDII